MNRYKSKSGVSNVVLLVALLIIAIIMMFVIKRQQLKFPKFKSSLTQFNGSAKAIGATYYNKPFRFSITAPDSNWEFVYPPNIDSSVLARSSEDSPEIVVTLNRYEQDDKIMVVKVGIFLLPEPISPRNLASRDLAKVEEQYRTEDEAVSIVSDVVIAGSRNAVGAFHVVELPLKTTHPFPVWITMFAIKKQLAYKIVCEVKRDKYEFNRADLEDILKSFTFL